MTEIALELKVYIFFLNSKKTVSLASIFENVIVFLKCFCNSWEVFLSFAMS